jgi:hypothetical protein
MLDVFNRVILILNTYILALLDTNKGDADLAQDQANHVVTFIFSDKCNEDIRLSFFYCSKCNGVCSLS